DERTVCAQVTRIGNTPAVSSDTANRVGRGIKPLRIAHHGDRNIRVGDGGRAAGVVNHIQDASLSSRGEEDREQIMQAPCRQGSGNLKRICGEDVHAVVEEAVTAQTEAAEALYAVSNLEGRPAVNAWSLHPRRLAGWVVGHLVLEEDVRAAVAVPDHLELLVVLDEQAVRGDVITVDDDASVGSVGGPAHAVTVVGPPCPDIIENDVVTIDDQAARRAARRRAADTEEHILKGRRVGGIMIAALVALVAAANL